jgi:hypothetical protein
MVRARPKIGSDRGQHDLTLSRDATAGDSEREEDNGGNFGEQGAGEHKPGDDEADELELR